MADFIKPPQETAEPEVQSSEPEGQTFEIDGQTYTQEELGKLVGLGKIGLEAEEKFDTKIDKVWPEYGRTKTELKKAQERLEELEKERQSSVQQPSLADDDQLRQAKEAARSLGIILKEDLAEYGIVTKEDAQKLFNEFSQGKELLNEVVEMEKQIDGSDGRPRFDAEEVLEYMKDTGIKDPEVAYKVKYESALNEWRETKMSEVKKPGLVTQSTSVGKKEPKPVKVTRDNLSELLKESLESNQ